MATLVISAGAALGATISATTASFIANTAISVGLGLAQRALTPDTTVRTQGSRLTNSQITASTEGSPINQITGSVRTGGQLIWTTTFKETVLTDTQTSGGKGGPRQTVENTDYRYSVSFAVGLCVGNGDVKLGRVWADGKPLDLSKQNYRFYDGDETQLPDPKIESVEGVNTVPAWRGLAYIVFEDMDLEEYGRRIPQITVEVARSVAGDSPNSIRNNARGFTLGDGIGEFKYGTVAYASDDGEGASRQRNVNGGTGDVDSLRALDQLRGAVGGAESVSVEVSWFATTDDANTCEIRPKVENDVDITTGNVTPSSNYFGASDPSGDHYGAFYPAVWRVSETFRRAYPQPPGTDYGTTVFNTTFPPWSLFDPQTTPVVEHHDRGTPSDTTVREIVQEAKARGLRVVFRPSVLVDISGAPTGRSITGNVTNMMGTTVLGDTTRDSQGFVRYSGPTEWSYRRMILHYARLLGDLLTEGDAFLVGSDMGGLSDGAGNGWGAALVQLMSDVAPTLDPGVLVSYAADWREYDAAELSAVWSAADFIGIDWFLPLTDWRVASLEEKTLDAFVTGMTSGEQWDFTYASEANRELGVGDPITDPADRQKDIGYWRDANHPGVPMWLTKCGCRAVHRGANEPDAKYGTDPYFSNGERDDSVQRLYIEAVLKHFADNPSIVDPTNIFLDSWDVRPYSEFPSLVSVWSDAQFWQTGRWLTGRIGAVSLGDHVLELCGEIGIPASRVDVTELATAEISIPGFMVTDLASPSARLENLMDTFMFDGYEDGDVVVFVLRANAAPVTIVEDDLVPMDDEGKVFSRKRLKDIDLPVRVKIDYLDATRDYAVASVDAHTVTGSSDRVLSFTSLAVLDTGYARGLADSFLQERWVARDTFQATVPFTSAESGTTYLGVVKPGKIFMFGGRTYRITRLSYGDGDIEITAVGYKAAVYDLVPHASATLSVASSTSFGPSFAQFLDIPLRNPASPNPWSPRIAVRQTPWSGAVVVQREISQGSGYETNTVIGNQSIVGETTTDLGSGPIWVWDMANTVTVRLYGSNDALESRDDASVLNGANTMLIQTPSGEWEVFQFANAALNGDGSYTLSRLLRGQYGTEPYMGDPTPTGARVIVYDSISLGALSGTLDLLGVDLALRHGPSGLTSSDARWTPLIVTPRGVAYRPYAPVQLKQARSGETGVLGGWNFDGILFMWQRRTRFDGDSWQTSVVPLNEDFEKYEVDILDGDTVVRTLGVDGELFVRYGDGEQVEDFGAVQDSVSWVVYQMSAVYGRGSPAYG